MNKFVATAVFAATCFLGAQASAATMLGANGTPLDYMIHNNAAPDGTTLTLDTKPAGAPYYVNYTSSDVLHAAGNGQGFAQVFGSPGFTDLTIDPLDPLAGFTAIKFRIDPINAPGKSPDFTFDVMITLAGGGTQTFLDNVMGGDNRWIITGDPGQIITSVKFYNLVGTTTTKVKGVSTTTSASYDFDSIRQVSFNAAISSAVPEPATWAMMIIGFGATGMMLRGANRRRSPIAA